MSNDDTTEARDARAGDEPMHADESTRAEKTTFADGSTTDVPTPADAFEPDQATTPAVDGGAAADVPAAEVVEPVAMAEADRVVDVPPPEVVDGVVMRGEVEAGVDEPTIGNEPSSSPSSIEPAVAGAALGALVTRVPGAPRAAGELRQPPAAAELPRRSDVDDVPLATSIDSRTTSAEPRVVVPQSKDFSDVGPGPLTAPAPLAATVVAAPAPFVKPPRLASLDIFRGLTIALMVLVNNPGSWSNLHAPLAHAEWHGWTMTDLVFPFFLFIVGVAIPFSLGKRTAAAAASGASSRGAMLGGIWTRALALVLLGILLSATAMPPPLADAPAGFPGTKAMRVIGFVCLNGALLALLVPWPWRRVAIGVPIAVAVLLPIYLFGMHVARAKAIAAGWAEADFGGGGFNPDMLRLPGVLQRIGICYGVAATIALFAGRKTVWLALVVLIAGYSVLMLNGRIKGFETKSLEAKDNFARRVDVAFFDRSYLNDRGERVHTQKHTYGSPTAKPEKYPDPEGLVSTLPAIGTTLLGVLAGWWLRRPGTTPAEKCAGLLARGVGVACVGVLLSWWLMPVNKQLWTPSFAVLTAGLGMLALGAVYWIADVHGRRWFFWPAKVMGMNAIAAFVASAMVPRIAAFFPFTHPRTGKSISAIAYLKGEAAFGLSRASDWAAVHAAWLPTLHTPENASLVGAVAFLLVIFALMLLLYVCRIFVKV